MEIKFIGGGMPFSVFTEDERKFKKILHYAVNINKEMREDVD